MGIRSRGDYGWLAGARGLEPARRAVNGDSGLDDAGYGRVAGLPQAREMAATDFSTSFCSLPRAAKKTSLKGLTAGADDYMTKPFDRAELKARINAGERILRLQAELAARVKELELALANVRLLQGLLPICCYCKKIRNDQNYWQQVDTYIADHSEAQFTHGICPECRDKIVKPELERLKADPQTVPG